MRSFRIGVAVIIALAASHAVSGDMYKCVGANGKVEYRDKPCEGDAAGVKITPRENTAGTAQFAKPVPGALPTTISKRAPIRTA